MAGLSIEVEFNHFGRVLSRLSPAVERRRRASIRTGVAEAKSRARVDTGEMRDSIHETDEGIVADDPKTVHHEYGTRFMSAQPMLHPAADIMRRDFVNRLLGLEADLL